MSFNENHAFSQAIAFGATGGPEYSTGVVELWGGAEQRNQRWATARYRYQLSLAPQDAEATQTLYAFFHTVARGAQVGFRFRDFNPGESVGLNEPLGLGTGGSADYPLRKRYTVGQYIGDRLISKPVPGTVTVAIDGTPTTGFTVDTTTGIVTLTAALDAVLTASFIFDVPVRFTSDQLPITRIDGAYFWQNIQLLETRVLA